MRIDVQCSQCQKRFRISEKFAGKRVKCPKCGGVIPVPEEPSQGTREAADSDAATGEPSGGAASDVQPVEEGAPGSGPKQRSATGSGKAGGGLPATEAESLSDTNISSLPQASAAAEGQTAAQPAVEQEDTSGHWYMQTDTGEQYGPVEREELDRWLAEDRIDDSCQILHEGWQQWRWADEVYPQLSPEKPELAGIAAAPARSAGGSGSSSGLAADAPGIRKALAGTRPWTMLLAIVSLALNGLVVLGGLIVVVAGLVIGAIALSAMGLPSLISGGLGGWMGWLLLGYALRIAEYQKSPDATRLQAALEAQRKFWTLGGILFLAMVGLWVIVVVLGAALGAFSGAM